MPGPPKLLRQKALPIDEIAVPEKTTITREQVALGLKIIREGGKSPSSKLPKKTVKEHWLHLQKRRKGDQDLSNVDTYLKHRIDKAKEKSKKKKKTDTSSLSAMSIESEESVKPEVATESTWWGKTGLRDVEDDDHLYLVSHGMLGGPKIGNWGDTRDQYSPDEIADRLVAAELPKTHRIVKLFACWSAVSVEPLDPDTVKDDPIPADDFDFNTAQETCDVSAWVLTGNTDNALVDDLGLTAPYDVVNPSFVPKAGSPLLGVSVPADADDWFDATDFIGAMGSEDWASWTAFPEN